MGYCSGLQQSCFHPLQYYRRSYLIPNNQLIHCPWQRGHLCTGNFIQVACLSLPFPIVPAIFLLPLSVTQQWAQTNSLCLFRSSARSYITPVARIRRARTTPIIQHRHTLQKIKNPLLFIHLSNFVSILSLQCWFGQVPIARTSIGLWFMNSQRIPSSLEKSLGSFLDRLCVCEWQHLRFILPHVEVREWGIWSSLREKTIGLDWAVGSWRPPTQKELYLWKSHCCLFELQRLRWEKEA